jgi:ABC-2 type transport system permease protein
MFKLWSSIQKDFRILTRDRVGLILMFAMPILLVIVITSVQNSTFELVNDNKIQLLIYDKDQGEDSKQFIYSLEKIGMFTISYLQGQQTEQQITRAMHERNALVAVVIPSGFSLQIRAKAKNIAARSLKDISVQEDSAIPPPVTVDALVMFYHPVMQSSFRKSIEGAIGSVLQIQQSKEIVNALYFSIHEKEIPDSLENEIVNNQVPIRAIPVSRNGGRNIPNASQHNIPAWTIFAMFFIVISLSSSVVREKNNGSFIRLKTLPTNFYLALLSKQITYLLLTLVQAAVIFMMCVWLFPHMGLPKLNLPDDLLGLFLVTLVCGLCAVSYAIGIGVFANTQEQANGIGAVSVVILAAIGGLLVPSFAMPAGFQPLLNISPLHWCLDAYYALFLEGGKLKDIWMNILSLLIITSLFQFLIIWGLKRKNLI